MSKKMMIVCDSCETTIENGDGNKLRITPHDGTKSPQEGDLCDACAVELYGELPTVARTGRKPGSTIKTRTARGTTARGTTRRRRRKRASATA